MLGQPTPDIGQLFHLHSSYSNARNDQPEPDPDLRPSHFRTYPGSLRHPLPATELDADMALCEALMRRHTVREFEVATVPLEQLARLLRMSYGVLGWSRTDGLWLPRRPVPSAGALYPLELYVAVQRVVGLPDGLYHYEARGHALELREAGHIHPRLARFTWVPPVINANLVILITAVIPRTVWKYGLRGYRFLWLEAGHLGQNLYLVAQALGLGALAVGAFSDQDMDRMAHLPHDERTLYLMCIGRPQPKEGGESPPT